MDTTSRSVFRDDIFQGKVAVVTGGTSGIGFATAAHLARHGAKVYAVGLGSENVVVPRDVKLELREIDVTDGAHLAALIGELDRLDILVPAAGISLGPRELEWENFNHVIDVLLGGVYRIIDLAHDLLAESRGSIVTIASIYANHFGGGRQVAYASAKGAVVQLTKSLAEAYASDGIRVNSVAPGWIETPMVVSLQDTEKRTRLIARTPLARLGQPEDVSKVIAFLASDAASFMTGAIVPVDGGYTVKGT